MSANAIVESTAHDPDVVPEEFIAIAERTAREYQHLTEERSIAGDVRFSLLGGLPASTKGERGTA